MSTSEIDSTLNDFLIETSEGIEHLDQECLKLESSDNPLTQIASIFRVTHTIKGGAGYMGFVNLQRLAHASENLLAKMRDGTVAVSKPRANVLLKVVDAFSRSCQFIASNHVESTENFAALIAELSALEHDQPTATENPSTAATTQAASAAWVSVAPSTLAASSPPLSSAESNSNTAKPMASSEQTDSDPAPCPVADHSVSSKVTHQPELRPATEASDKTEPTETQRSPSDESSDSAPVNVEGGNQKTPATIGQILIELGKATPRQISEALEQQEAGDPLRLGEILVERGIVSIADIRLAMNRLAELNPPEQSFVRVPSLILDRMFCLSSEFEQLRAQFLRLIPNSNDALQLMHRFEFLSATLRDELVRSRLLPISSVLNRLPRLVRQITTTCQKQVNLECQGQDLQVDRSIVDALGEPLLHLIRNAVDHGIEPSEVRAMAGKMPVGRIRVRCQKDNRFVQLEISDDGGGINLERLKAKAIEAGLLTTSAAEDMCDLDAMQLIFEPGISTASTVSDISGRGVGMDAVRNSIRKINGSIDVYSKRGVGTTFKIRILNQIPVECQVVLAM